MAELKPRRGELTTGAESGENALYKANDIYSAIDNAPTADVAKVRYGKWRYYHKQNIAVCTECSFERNMDANFGRAVSCPNCGAKMDGGAD